jgi:hypothetical protein
VGEKYDGCIDDAAFDGIGDRIFNSEVSLVCSALRFSPNAAKWLLSGGSLVREETARDPSAKGSDSTSLVGSELSPWEQHLNRQSDILPTSGGARGRLSSVAGVATGGIGSRSGRSW